MQQTPVDNRHWDLSPYFDSTTSPEVKDAVSKLQRDAEGLLTRVNKIEKISSNDAASLFAELAELRERMSWIGSFAGCSVAANVNDDDANALNSSFSKVRTVATQLEAELNRTIAASDWQSLASGELKSIAYFLKRASAKAVHQMGSGEESLAAELGESGRNAWVELYGKTVGKIEVSVKGLDKTVSMSQARAMAYDNDREVREAAYKGEISSWEDWEHVIAACFNGFKGSSIALANRRHWGSTLEKAIDDNAVTQKTLDAMHSACKESLPMLRRYLKAKAKMIGVQTCAFYDLFAPIPAAKNRDWTYDDAGEFVQQIFDEFSPTLGQVCRDSIKDRWIDVDPRPGKVDGAFCAGGSLGRSLILLNFKPSFGSVSTLAHELGHAFHNACLYRVGPLMRRVPSTLAETASTFCETLVRRKYGAKADKQEKLAILEAALGNGTQVVMDIHSRFLFESRAVDARKARELSPSELCGLMKQAQLETYGDGLAEHLMHPYMWAAKPHYYGSDFYNFPYTFGLLFGLGLYRIYEQEPDTFIARYEDLLRDCGSAYAKELALRFGIDIESPEFWRQSLSVFNEDVQEFEALA